ncbi:hypothetical protein AB0M83_27875 [Amycolatopsis sp. NPDC051106]
MVTRALEARIASSLKVPNLEGSTGRPKARDLTDLTYAALGRPESRT